MSVLSTSLALPLITSPSVAASTVNNSNSYSLLADRFDDYYERWRALHNLDVAKYEEIEFRVFERTGHKFSDRQMSDIYWNERIAVLRTFPADRQGYVEDWDAILTEGDELFRLILTQRPATGGDLILQARACAMMNRDMWLDQTTVESLERGEQGIRTFIENLMSVHGEELFPGVTMLQSENASIDHELSESCNPAETPEPSPAALNPADPIHDAIAAHKAAAEHLNNIYSICPRTDGSEFDTWEQNMDAAYDTEQSIRSDLFGCTPTTGPGISAFLTYLLALAESEKDEWRFDINDARNLFGSLLKAFRPTQDADANLSNERTLRTG